MLAGRCQHYGQCDIFDHLKCTKMAQIKTILVVRNAIKNSIGMYYFEELLTVLHSFHKCDILAQRNFVKKSCLHRIYARIYAWCHVTYHASTNGSKMPHFGPPIDNVLACANIIDYMMLFLTKKMDYIQNIFFSCCMLLKLLNFFLQYWTF